MKERTKPTQKISRSFKLASIISSQGFRLFIFRFYMLSTPLATPSLNPFPWIMITRFKKKIIIIIHASSRMVPLSFHLCISPFPPTCHATHALHTLLDAFPTAFLYTHLCTVMITLLALTYTSFDFLRDCTSVLFSVFVGLFIRLFSLGL